MKKIHPKNKVEKQDFGKVTKQIFDCPSCGKPAEYKEIIYEVPHFGKMLIGSLVCGSCLWKNTQTFSLSDQHKPVKFEVKIQTIKDMETKVIRANTATVLIPELGIEISPTTFTDGYYNNVEGLLELANEAVSISKGKKSKEIQGKIALAREGKFPFTVILEDPAGNSILIGKKLKK